MIRVLLADDEALVRAGVRAILTSDREIEVVAEVATGGEAVELARAHRPDVAVLDIRMPGLDGLSAARDIRTATPDTAVAMLTTFGDDAFVARALDVGATGFMLKASDPRELIAGVRAVSNGGAYLSPSVAIRVLAELKRGDLGRGALARARIERLTSRERDVLAMVGTGLSNGQIAGRLFVVEGTVKTHVSAIFDKLGVQNRVQAAIVAYEADLVDL
ncbi:response regulator [Cryptosporangium sp. NPDC048952]|uniref:response regulator n=1 Tax=Cryptosporangium sp. NPDC048952 TaxID=3363961 RepID=UPI0037200FCA